MQSKIVDPNGILNQKSMTAPAPNGHKVKVTETSFKNGWDHKRDHVEKFLKVGGLYTVERTEMHSWHTKVWLQEIPNEEFNSVNFEDA